MTNERGDASGSNRDPQHQFVGIMSNGTSGDINNMRFTAPKPKLPHYQHINEVAELLSQRVADAHRDLHHHAWVDLAAESQELELAYRKPDEATLRHFERLRNRDSDQPVYHRQELTYSRRVDLRANGPDSVSILLQAFRIGDLGVASIPFEVFAETGLEIKRRSPLGSRFTVELANGGYGYLPTPAQHKLGGYETWMGTSKVQLDASEKMVDTLVGLFEASLENSSWQSPQPTSKEKEIAELPRILFDTDFRADCDDVGAPDREA